MITISFLGGGVDSAVLDFVGYMQDSVDEVVVDDKRLAEARTTLRTMQKLTSTNQKANQKAFKTLLAELSDSETDFDTVEALWGSYYESIESYNKEMIDLRFELRGSLTEDEWQKVFGHKDS